jgi:hypothetical protein
MARGARGFDSLHGGDDIVRDRLRIEGDGRDRITVGAADAVSDLVQGMEEVHDFLDLLAELTDAENCAGSRAGAFADEFGEFYLAEAKAFPCVFRPNGNFTWQRKVDLDRHVRSIGRWKHI